MDNKKVFQEPVCEIIAYLTEDILIESDWGGGNADLWSLRDV